MKKWKTLATASVLSLSLVAATVQISQKEFKKLKKQVRQNKAEITILKRKVRRLQGVSPNKEEEPEQEPEFPRRGGEVRLQGENLQAWNVAHINLQKAGLTQITGDPVRANMVHLPEGKRHQKNFEFRFKVNGKVRYVSVVTINGNQTIGSQPPINKVWHDSPINPSLWKEKEE